MLSTSLLFGNQRTNQSAPFADPYVDLASMVMPRSAKDILDLCEKLWMRNGMYRMAAGRIVRYFITRVAFGNTPETTATRFRTFLENRLRVTEELTLQGDDVMCYGNAMSSVVVPFTRVLICSKCRSEVLIDHADCVFENWQFRAYCHKCRERCTHTHDDRPSRDESRIRIKRWAPQEFQLVHHFHSQDTEYYWRIPAQLRTLIGGGSMFHVKQTPWEIIQAVKGDTFFKFNRGVIYHMKESTVAGVDAQGWGVSRMLSTFAQAYYVQMLTRYNEALVADYLTPMRLVSPKAGSTSTDPAMIASMQQFKSRFAAMVAQHRRDPATWHFMPFPVEYQALGGEVKLASHELINQAIDQQLSSIGIPPDLYRGTMELQVMPTALRLFQASWPHLVSAFNGWLEHVAEAVCTHMTWDKPESVRLEPVTTADDVELRQTWLQLAASNLVSRRTAFAPWQLDPVEEQRQVLQETKKFEEMQREMQEDVEQRQLSRQSVAGHGQAAPPGGAPPGAMGAGQQAVSGGGITIEDMQAQAEEMAQQLVRMPEGPRKRQLQAVRTQAPVLHSLVTANMEKIRSAAGSAGREQLASGQM